MSTWQTFDSFPKDGESYLVCNAEVSDGHCMVVSWDHVRAEADPWCLETGEGQFFHRNAFTHWMPLPPLPAGPQ